MTDRTWRRQYIKYLNSTSWSIKRSAFLIRANYCCAHCKCQFLTPGALQVHHLHYHSLGKETPEDVEVLCKPCHTKADEIRAAAGRGRSQAARFNAGLDTYMTKKYGPEWSDRIDEDHAAEEFDQWLEDRDE